MIKTLIKKKGKKYEDKYHNDVKIIRKNIR